MISLVVKSEVSEEYKCIIRLRKYCVVYDSLNSEENKIR
jgi:hypothetical protein